MIEFVRWKTKDGTRIVERNSRRVHFIYSFLMDSNALVYLCDHYDEIIEKIPNDPQVYYFDSIEFRFITLDKIKIIAMPRDETSPLYNAVYEVKPLFEFIPVFQHARKNAQYDEMEITFDGKKYRLFLDGKEYTDSYGSTFKDYCNYLNRNCTAANVAWK